MIKKEGAPDTHKQKIPLKFIIEGKEYETVDQYKTGAELKQLAGIPLEIELFLSISKPYEDELIEDETKVNLARPETEYFFVKKKLFFTINGIKHTWYKQFIRGIQIRELGKISKEEKIFLDLPGGWKDNLITDDEVVDLARPGVEHFVARRHTNDIIIIVNAEDKKYNKPKISYEEVVKLALGKYDSNRGYTVKYTEGPSQNPKGMLSRGAEVYVKNKMNFNVASTHKS